MAVNETKFEADLDRFVINTMRKADKAFRIVAFAVFDDLVKASPIYTGNFRSHWRVGLNQVDPYFLPGGRYLLKKYAKAAGISLPAGAIPASHAYSSAYSVLPKAKYLPNQTIYITNHVLYGERNATGSGNPKEDGRNGPGLNAGTSSQAPSGWFEACVSRNLSKLQKGGLSNAFGRL